MKVTLLTTVNSRNAGGLFYSVRNLAKFLMLQGKYDISILSHNDKFSDIDIAQYENIPMTIYNTSNISALNKIGYSSDLLTLLRQEQPSVIHQQGIWLYHSFASLHYKKRHPSVKTIIAPRGMLDMWAVKRSSFTKKIIQFLYEDENLKRADCIHALCQSEYESIRKFGLKNPVAIIPNGTTIPEWKRTKTDKEKKTMLFLGRIHPKKGIKEFIIAIFYINKRNPSLLNNWTFQIGGWSQEGHLEELQGLVAEYKLDNCFEFIGSLYGEEKEKALKNADVFILPSYSEGMPMAVLEAWAYELPVVMTDFCNIPEGFAANAAHRIDTEPQIMSKQLESFFLLPQQQIDAIGRNGLNLVKENYTWDVVSKKMIQLYDWILNVGEKPEFVY
ncbi:poly(glycerol-phosphate) alpha-glucosyltransferase [Bacteroidia bacterium]|nr:poly(glycerol-phosphate) alpha-glucosyltransferase [Bacteroidia bacterium]